MMLLPASIERTSCGVFVPLSLQMLLFIILKCWAVIPRLNLPHSGQCSCADTHTLKGVGCLCDVKPDLIHYDSQHRDSVTLMHRGTLDKNHFDCHRVHRLTPAE